MHNSVLAIDGGGTKTAAIVADAAGNVRNLTPSQGCNPQDGPDWKTALDAIFAQIQNIDFAVIGLPGFGEIPQHDAQVCDFIQSRIGANHLIVNDVELALHSAFPNGDGVVLLAGTGSMAIGKAKGHIQRVGGWGPLFGDEGSAFWIGQKALTYAASELDGRRPPHGFAGRLATALNAPQHRFGLLDWVANNDNNRAQVASVARVVDDLNRSGDPVAGSILDAAADQLVELARAVSPLLLPWCPSGSVFQSTRIMDGVVRQLGQPTQPANTTLGGGLCRAASLASWSITPDWVAKITSHSSHA